MISENAIVIFLQDDWISAMVSHNQPETQVSGKDWKIGEGATGSAGPEKVGSRF